ncbi:MAG: pantetheine-phosphate adenylyltransferase [Gammaproteobacteria bacterium]|nr:pantetheine-phosphate adenylyltransferase [Gammaproteobacteria bacterium]
MRLGRGAEVAITAIYPGTFDPVTRGHTDLILRSTRLFEHTVVAVAESRGKGPLFTLEERIAMVESSLGNHGNRVSILGFNTLLVDFATTIGATVIVRGLRAVSDFEYEFQLAGMNRHLSPQIETLFLTPAAEYSYLSSSLVKEVAALGGDIEGFVDPIVATALQKRIG